MVLADFWNLLLSKVLQKQTLKDMLMSCLWYVRHLMQQCNHSICHTMLYHHILVELNDLFPTVLCKCWMNGSSPRSFTGLGVGAPNIPNQVCTLVWGLLRRNSASLGAKSISAGGAHYMWVGVTYIQFISYSMYHTITTQIGTSEVKGFSRTQCAFWWRITASRSTTCSLLCIHLII